MLNRWFIDLWVGYITVTSPTAGRDTKSTLSQSKAPTHLTTLDHLSEGHTQNRKPEWAALQPKILEDFQWLITSYFEVRAIRRQRLP